MGVNGHELLASGSGQRLERWCGRVILRPETAAVWPWAQGKDLPEWDGLYHGNAASGGSWEWRNPLPDASAVHYGNLSFLVKPTASKHLGLFPEPIRYIADDALTFLQREIRRGNRYDAVIMDPPPYGRGKRGELWNLSEHLPSLLEATISVLSETPLFILLNTYTDDLDAEAGELLETMTRSLPGSVKTVPLGLTGSIDARFLPLGKAHRWTP